MATDLFIQLTGLLVITVLVSGVMRFLKQPLIIGYIISGILAGPFFLDFFKGADAFTTFSQIGIALLLFMVGLNLNPKVIKEVGKVSLITGVGQVLFTSLVGFLISRALGFSLTVSLYIAVALTFSSTIIIMKLLSDRNDLETLYGRIAVGFLIVQDLIAIAVLMLISSLSNGLGIQEVLLGSLLKGGGAIILIFVISVYLLPRMMNTIAKSQEFLLLSSLGWCFSVALLFHFLNFSIEAGALIAGVSLSLSPYHLEISSKMRPLRDFFILIFFLLLGSQLTFGNSTQYIIPVIVFSLFILIGNPLIVLTLMGFLGYTKRNSFMAGLTVAQISEFSFVLVGLGVTLGHVTREILSLITLVGLITIAGSTYMILYADRIYPHFSKFLSIFERKGRKIDEHHYHENMHYDIVLFGYNRMGADIMESLNKIKKKLLIIDYNPDTVIELAKKGYECKYGDANDLEMLNDLNFSKTKMAISTIPDTETNLLLVNKLNEVKRKIIFICISHNIDDAVKLYNAGATYVIMPHFLGGKHISSLIESHGLSFNKFIKEKIMHIEHIKIKKEQGHEHPRHERS